MDDYCHLCAGAHTLESARRRFSGRELMSLTELAVTLHSCEIFCKAHLGEFLLFSILPKLWSPGSFGTVLSQLPNCMVNKANVETRSGSKIVILISGCWESWVFFQTSTSIARLGEELFMP